MLLAEIQKLQFTDKAVAELELLGFLKKNEDPAIVAVELTPRAQSLNSINGYVTYNDGERFFFKTHTEENEQLSEYYNVAILARAGYPIFEAKRITHRPGNQIVLYEIIPLPTMFDLIKVEEDNLYQDDRMTAVAATLLHAQEKLDKQVYKIYASTLKMFTEEQDLKAPVHQLFWHRLQKNGRLGLFHRNKGLDLHGHQVAFEELVHKNWVINGVLYEETLDEIITRSQNILRPAGGAAIIGHGDAHNGNLFVDLKEASITMFDPAFAGTHSLLLDLVKPTFHNVFARWMYYPEQADQEFSLDFKIEDDKIFVDHTFIPSDLRRDFLTLQKKEVLTPAIQLLKDNSCLRKDWQIYMRSALFCCPFLTVNLLAERNSDGTLAERYSLPIRLLGLSLAVQFGASSHKKDNELSNIIDSLFSV